MTGRGILAAHVGSAHVATTQRAARSPAGEQRVTAVQDFQDRIVLLGVRFVRFLGSKMLKFSSFLLISFARDHILARDDEIKAQLI